MLNQILLSFVYSETDHHHSDPSAGEGHRPCRGHPGGWVDQRPELAEPQVGLLGQGLENQTHKVLCGTSIRPSRLNDRLASARSLQMSSNQMQDLDMLET